MLVLSRKTQQQIRISDDIVITVLQVKGKVVRFGIEAPRHVRVVRGELPRKASPTESANAASVDGNEETPGRNEPHAESADPTNRLGRRSAHKPDAAPLLRFVQRATRVPAAEAHAI